MRRLIALPLSALLLAVVLLAGVGGAIEAQQPTNLGSDANGNPMRRALKTGHVSNYDETKVPPYTLPDPLVFCRRHAGAHRARLDDEAACGVDSALRDGNLRPDPRVHAAGRLAS